jgi:hypothetical protein
MERIRQALEQAEIDRQKAGVSEKPAEPKTEAAVAANEPVGSQKSIIHGSSGTVLHPQTLVLFIRAHDVLM